MLAQRVFGIALGYPGLNDHDELRRGPALQVAAEREPDPEKQLASAPTLCRLAGRMGREALWGMAEVPVESFIATRPAPLQRLLLDFDATDDPVFGQQESYCARVRWRTAQRSISWGYLPTGPVASVSSRASSGCFWRPPPMCWSSSSGACFWPVLNWPGRRCGPSGRSC